MTSHIIINADEYFDAAESMGASDAANTGKWDKTLGLAFVRAQNNDLIFFIVDRKKFMIAQLKYQFSYANLQHDD